MDIFAFGSPEQLHEGARQFFLMGLVVFPLVVVIVRKSLSLGLVPCILATLATFILVMLVFVVSNSRQFYSVERKPGYLFFLFEFPYRREEVVVTTDILDLKFGMAGGKGVYRCYLSVRTVRERLTSQSTRDCEYIKKTALILRGAVDESGKE